LPGSLRHLVTRRLTLCLPKGTLHAQQVRLLNTCYRRIMRRAWSRVVAPSARFACATRSVVNTQTRDEISRVATKVKEEANGQALDIAEMADAARSSMKVVQEALGRYPDGGGDPKVKGKLQTLSASLKAYQNRLNNVQNEAKSIHREAETLVKHVWGTEAPETVEAEPVKAESTTGGKVEVDDFDAEAPHVAKILESEKSTASRSQQSSSSPNQSSSSEAKPADADVEVEVLEVEVESPVDDVPVTQITQELYERGIDFSDCHDAAGLRKRYTDVLAGKFDKQEPPRQASSQRQAPPAPERPTQYQQQQSQQQGAPGWQQGTPNTTETGLAFDPHPGAMRKMIDPMKAVWEVKQDVARENGVDPSQIDLWSGMLKLDDHKRLYEYGQSLQANPIEVRSKGDAPQHKKF
jgi:hypothetical protein